MIRHIACGDCLTESESESESVSVFVFVFEGGLAAGEEWVAWADLQSRVSAGRWLSPARRVSIAHSRSSNERTCATSS
jgi:hypothetical protein